MLSKKRHPAAKPLCLSPVLKTAQNSWISSSAPFSVLCFFPLSTKVVYISLLCLACRLFSLYKRPVPEKGLIMWNAQFLLVQLPVVLREFCMGGCRCELKKMGRCWRNRRCCECEWKNWIVEHFLSCSKTNYWWKFYSEKNLFWALCAWVFLFGVQI